MLWRRKPPVAVVGIRSVLYRKAKRHDAETWPVVLQTRDPADLYFCHGIQPALIDLNTIILLHCRNGINVYSNTL